jgi:hypothetical protein
VSYYAKQSGPEGATWLLIDGVAVATFWNPGGQALAETVAGLLNTTGEREWLRGMLLDANQSTIDNLRAAFEAVAGSATPTAELTRLREFVAAHDAVQELIADQTDDAYAYNQAVTRLNAARASVAGSATLTQEHGDE